MEFQRGDQIATGHSGECGGQGAHPDVGGEVGGHRYARQPSLLLSALFPSLPVWNASPKDASAVGLNTLVVEL